MSWDTGNSGTRSRILLMVSDTDTCTGGDEWKAEGGGDSWGGGADTGAGAGDSWGGGGDDAGGGGGDGGDTCRM